MLVAVWHICCCPNLVRLFLAMNSVPAAGNANVSHALQPELQGCMMVRQQDVVTAATCAYSADIWILDQTSTQPLLTGASQHCSVQQVSYI